MELPICIPAEDWHLWWPIFGVGRGSITPEEIPDAVLWASDVTILTVDEQGTYLLANGG